jgi:16S rRNA (cytosine967-C5)-methyltransferase
MADVSRIHALEIFQHVLRRRQPMDVVIAGQREFARLSGPEQAFARRIVTTALRRLGQIDDVIARCMEKPLPAKAHIAQDVLRLGVAQLLFMEIPDHAAVDTSVRLFQARGEGGYAKLINAVLRRLTREAKTWLAAQDAARLNTPDWLWHSWSAAYGDDTCRHIAEAHLIDPPLDISVKSDPDSWAARLGGRVMPGGTIRLYNAGAVSSLEGFEDGAWWVQDMAAHVVSGLLGDVSGKTVIDLCAAPGGKTACLAAAGAHVTAVDRSAKRLNRLRENLDRLKLTADVIEADAAAWRPSAPADAVLLDAPCSATGTLRRHPDVAHGKNQSDVDKLAILQHRLLAAAADMVKPGGTVLYVTCSLQPDEGSAITNQALSADLPLALASITESEVHGLRETLTTDGRFRSLPHHLSSDGGMDSFYACRFQRI